MPRCYVTRTMNLSLATCAAMLAMSTTLAAAEGLPRPLPPQMLADALDAFARETGIQILYNPELTADIKTSGAAAGRSIEAALRELLRDTGLTFEFVNARTVTLQPVAGSQQRSTDVRGTSPTTYDATLQTSSGGDSFSERIRQARTASGKKPATSAAEKSERKADVSAAGRDTLETIVVTALKREQMLLDTPLAVSAFTGNSIEQSGYDDLSSFIQRAPGVTMVGGSIQIRGISSIFGAATVGYYLDELPFSFLLHNTVPDVRAWDLERVEVLRGPQGTLYGANSIGGTVRVLTSNPDFDTFEVKAEASSEAIRDGGNVYEAKAALNVPLIDDKLAVRVAGTYQDFGGVVDAPFGRDVDQNTFKTLRGKLAYRVADNLRLTLSAWSNELDAEGDSRARRNRISSNPYPNASTTQYEVYGATVDYSAPRFDVVSASSYMTLETGGENTGFYATPPVLTTSTVTNETFSQEVRLVSSTDGPLLWTVGGLYQDVRERQVANLPGIVAGRSAGSSKSWAVFGEGTYRFGHGLEATLGGRYYEDRRENGETLSGLPPIPRVDGTYDTFNPKFNLAWRPSDNSLWYVTAAKGFRSGQNQPASSLFIATLFGIPVPEQVEPETLLSYEIGNKTAFLGQRLSLETAVYYNDWRDLQVTIQAGGIVGALVNAGKAHAQGVDVSLDYAVTRFLSLAASGNINESVYDDTLPGVFAPGDRITNVPKYTYTLSATDRRPFLSTGLQSFLRLELQKTAKRMFSAQGYTGVSDPQAMLSLRFGLEAQRWGIYLTGQNLLDEDGYIAAPIATTDFNTEIPQPRTFGIVVRGSY